MYTISISKRTIYIFTAVLALSLLVAGSVLAGNITSSATPGATNSYTLADIYNRLDTGATGTQSAFTEPGVAPGTGTMADLNTIMGKAPAVDNTNGAGVADVASGKTFWGLSSGEWGLQTGTASGGATYNAGVPKTGQTTSYATGDDGDLERGAAWPNPRFTDNTDGTVTDNLTGLMWMKNADAGNDCAGTDTGTETWANALASAAACNNDGGYAGYGDWRLPNVRELQSLVHYGFVNPAVPNTAGTGQWSADDPFTAVQSNFFYWSSTSTAHYTPAAWYVSLYYGDVDFGGKSNSYYVWPVRAGQ